MYKIPVAGGQWKSSALDDTFAGGGQQRMAPLWMVKGRVFGAACSSAKGVWEIAAA